MANSLIDKVNADLAKFGIKPRTSAAQAWLREKVTALRIFIGRMYFYHYDPKLKDVLPVWDKFPLVIPIEMYDDGFLGLNLHYLDPYNRLALLNKLYEFANNDKYDDTTRLNLSYSLLSSSRRYKMIEPCIKRYLLSHIRSSLIYIEPDNWETAIFLPTEKMVYKK